MSTPERKYPFRIVRERSDLEFRPNFGNDGKPLPTMWDEFRSAYSPTTWVAQQVGLTRWTLRDLVKQGKVRALTIGKDTWINLDDVRKYVASPRHPGGRPRRKP